MKPQLKAPFPAQKHATCPKQSLYGQKRDGIKVIMKEWYDSKSSWKSQATDPLYVKWIKPYHRVKHMFMLFTYLYTESNKIVVGTIVGGRKENR